MQSSSQNAAAGFSRYFCPWELWLAGVPWVRSAHPLMCPTLTSGNKNCAQRYLHINTCSNPLNKGLYDFYFHFATINIYKFLQVGQVFLHTLFALLFLQQQVKKKPSKQKPAEKSQWLYLLVLKPTRASFLQGKIIWGAVADCLRAAFPVAGSSSGSPLPHLPPTCTHSLKRIPHSSTEQKSEEEMLGNALTTEEELGSRESPNSSHNQGSKTITSMQVGRCEVKGGKGAHSTCGNFS